MEFGGKTNSLCVLEIFDVGLENVRLSVSFLFPIFFLRAELFFPNPIFRYDNSTDKCPAAINYPVTKSYLRSCFDRKRIKVDQIPKTADAKISNGKKPLSLHLDL